MLGLCEALSHLTLAISSAVTGLSYEHATVSTDRISAEHRRIIERLVDGETSYYRHDPDLGWSIIPHGRSALYQANGHGMRNDREFETKKPDGVLRVAAFGDSFTHCDGVPNPDSWPERLMAMNARIEVLNFGVSGYGPDQALLRYRRDGRAFDPDIVLIGYMPENIKRVVNVFRPFYGKTKLPLSKPRFVLDGDSLSLLPNPLDDLGDYRDLLQESGGPLNRMAARDDHAAMKCDRGPEDVLGTVRLFKTLTYAVQARFSSHAITTLRGVYDQDSGAFALTRRILTDFCHEVTTNGSRPIVLILPGSVDVSRYRAGDDPRYGELVARLREDRISVFDLNEAFDEYAADRGPEALFDGHYSSLGNEVVAKYLMRRVQEFPGLAAESGPTGLAPGLVSSGWR